MGNTALYFAVVSGKLALVEAMLKNNDYQLPIYNATLLGRRDIVNYLYGACKDLLGNEDCSRLPVPLIDADVYVKASDLVKGDWFATCREGSKVEALNALARKSHLSASTSSQVPLKYICEKVASDDKEISYMERERWRPIFVATEQGNVGFLRILFEKLPDAVIKRNGYRQTIFHVAEVFNLLSDMGSSFKYLISRYEDVHRNNMLHLAGMYPRSDYLELPFNCTESYYG